MKKSLSTFVLLASATFANLPLGAQTFQNGPYYANPSWDQQIPAAQRFIVLSNWNNAAVLDRETGIVWQRSPDIHLQMADWFLAIQECHFFGTGAFPPVGNRIGWRLPSVEELQSLVDPTQSNPALPAGHPFQGIQNGVYWTATTNEFDPTRAYTVDFSTGQSAFGTKIGAGNNFYWCVRGGASVSNPPY